MITKSCTHRRFFHSFLFSRLWSTKRRKKIISRLSSLNFLVQFLNFSTFSANLLRFLNSQLTVFLFSFFHNIAGSLQNSVTLFHLCSHVKSPSLAFILTLSRVKSWWYVTLG